jgi:hypothetical protein
MFDVLTENQKAVRMGSIYLRAAQIAINVLDSKYDPEKHGSSSNKTPTTPEEKLRKAIWRNKSKDKKQEIDDFISACIYRGLEYVPVLKAAGLLDEDFPQVDEDNPITRVASEYLVKYSTAPYDQEREKHNEKLKQGIASPQKLIV